MEPLLLYSSLLLLLLLSPQAQALASTQGRGPPHYQLEEPAPKAVGVVPEGAEAMSAARIGSRPPRCEGRCAMCGQCEAVQVPVAPRDKGGSHFFRLSGAAFGGGDDDDEGSTNYKPLNWKCRCADRRPILNP